MWSYLDQEWARWANAQRRELTLTGDLEITRDTRTVDELPPAERAALLRAEAESTLEAITDARYRTRVGTSEYTRVNRIEDRAIARLRRRGGVYPPEY